MDKALLNKNSSTFINLLRVIASQMVVIGHLMKWLNIFPSIQPPHLPYIQCVGVVLFFILSGFVIPYSTSLKFNQTGSYSFKEYFIDRFARIYSSYIPCLAIIFLLDIGFIAFSNCAYDYYDGFNFKTFFANLLMLQNFPLENYFDFFKLTSFGSGRPLWTLAIEWWIYFWFGFLYLVIIKQKKMNLLIVFVFLVFSIVPFLNFSVGRGSGLMLPWLLGCLVLVLFPIIQSFKLNKFFIIFLIGILSVMIFRRYQITHFKYVEFYYVCLLSLVVLFLLILFHEISFKEKVIRVINFLADYSFTLYLLHYSIISILISMYAKTVNPYLIFIVGIVLSNLVSIFVAYFTEMKYKTFREFLKKKFIKIQNS